MIKSLRTLKIFSLSCSFSAISLLYLQQARADNNAYLIFVTEESWNGEGIDGIQGADAKCQAEATKSYSGTYKAMLTNADRNTAHNWVLKPNTEYFNVMGKRIGTTNESAAFNETLDDDIYAPDGSCDTFKIWTGFNSNWEVSDSICSGWTTGSNSSFGSYGISHTKTVSEAISYGVEPCMFVRGSRARLYCVQQ